ncbi:MAG: hypothetical protein NTU45_03920 [Planctomycetota bacterium]|nr:hypothetical protein [Planctomycetota bacterium]
MPARRSAWTRVARCWTYASRRSRGSGSSLSDDAQLASASRTRSTTNSCSRRSFALASSDSPSSRSATPSTPRGRVPATASLRAVRPLRETSRSGVTPRNARPGATSIRNRNPRASRAESRASTATGSSAPLAAYRRVRASTSLRIAPERMRSSAPRTARVHSASPPPSDSRTSAGSITHASHGVTSAARSASSFARSVSLAMCAASVVVSCSRRSSIAGSTQPTAVKGSHAASRARAASNGSATNHAAARGSPPPTAICVRDACAPNAAVVATPTDANSSLVLRSRK